MKAQGGFDDNACQELSVAVGFSYVLGIPLGYGLVGMWIGFALDENIRGVILMRRWWSGKWRSKGFVKEISITNGEI